MVYARKENMNQRLYLIKLTVIKALGKIFWRFKNLGIITLKTFLEKTKELFSDSKMIGEIDINPASEHETSGELDLDWRL